jgi:hypothetical protein
MRLVLSSIVGHGHPADVAVTHPSRASCPTSSAASFLGSCRSPEMKMAPPFMTATSTRPAIAS